MQMYVRSGGFYGGKGDGKRGGGWGCLWPLDVTEPVN